MQFSNILKRLTSNYRKDEQSNNYKLLKLAADEIETVKELFEQIEIFRDIDQAEAAALDNIGRNVGQQRGATNDEIYRVLIKSRIARNLSGGDINTVIRVIALTLNTDVENVEIIELWNTLDEEPAAVQINIPTALLNEINFSITQFGRLVNRIVAAGVRANVLFEGTFQFSSQLDVVETDIDTGFSEVDQLEGGKLGAIYDPASDTDIPLD